jgi:hypothetical protein
MFFRNGIAASTIFRWSRISASAGKSGRNNAAALGREVEHDGHRNLATSFQTLATHQQRMVGVFSTMFSPITLC